VDPLGLLDQRYGTVAVGGDPGAIVRHLLQILWYGYYGGGAPQHWQDVDAIRNHPDVRTQTECYEWRIAKQACDSGRAYYAARRTAQEADRLDVHFHDALFSEYLSGDSYLTVNAGCRVNECRYDCTFAWELHDRFDLHPDEHGGVADLVIALLMAYHDPDLEGVWWNTINSARERFTPYDVTVSWLDETRGNCWDLGDGWPGLHTPSPEPFPIPPWMGDPSYPGRPPMP
jgi:hypothetical protein